MRTAIVLAWSFCIVAGSLPLRGEETTDSSRVRIILKDGGEMSCERIEFYRGNVKLFTSTSKEAEVIPFTSVERIVFLEVLEEEEASKGPPGTSSGTAGPTPRVEKEGRVFTPFIFPELRDRRIPSLDKSRIPLFEDKLLSGHGPSKGVHFRIAILVNALIKAGKLEEYTAKYKAMLKAGKPPSRRDMTLRVLLCACLNRLDHAKGLEEELMAFRRYYPKERLEQRILDILHKEGERWLVALLEEFKEHFGGRPFPFRRPGLRERRGPR